MVIAMKGLMQLKKPVDEASYIVFTDGSKYYAKNGTTGMIEYSDADATKVIQYAIDKVGQAGGGKIVIKRGTYILTDPDGDGFSLVVRYPNVVIDGEDSAVLKLADNTFTGTWSSGSNYMMLIDARDVTVRGLTFDGNKTTNGAGNGLAIMKIKATEAENNKIVYNKFINISGHAVYTRLATDSIVAYNYFYNNNWYDIAFDSYSHRNIAFRNVIKNSIGIELYTGSSYCVIAYNVIRDQGLDGIGNPRPAFANEARCVGTLLIGNKFYNTQHWAIVLGGDNPEYVINNLIYAPVRNSSFQNPPNAGIYIGGKNKVIQGNILVSPSGNIDGITVRDNTNNIVVDNVVTGFSDGIMVWKASNNIIARNRVYNNSRSDIYIYDASSSNNIIEFNNFVGSTSPSIIIDDGTNTIKRRNLGYQTEASGVATISAGSTRVTVSHGLAKTPSKFQITPLGQPAGKLWVENITSTSFDIVTDTAPASDLKVSWYAEV